MKEIIFTEDQLPDLETLGASLFGDENDPRSYLYVRKLHRPKLNWFRILCSILLPVIFSVALGWALLIPLQFSLAAAILIPAGLFLLYVILRAKAAAICLVKIYQRYAPAGIRNKCRFEPSCSEYMILSIEKYGLIKGLSKGTNRLRRCNVDHGGYDMP